MFATFDRSGSLRTLGKRLAAALLDWRLALLVGTYLALTLLLFQVPFTYSFIVGKERGAMSDMPFIQNFNPPESSPGSGRWRWSRAEAGLDVPGVGQRSLIVSMRIISHRAQWLPDAPPTVLRLQPGPDITVPVTLQPEGRRYQFYVPARAVQDGRLWLGLATEQWQNESRDRRENLGVAIGEYITIESVAAQGGFVWPGRDMLLLWSLGLALLWLALRVLAFAPGQALALLLPLAVVVPLLLPLEAPRIGFGSVWSLQAGMFGLAAALFCVLAVPPLLRWLDMLPTPGLLRWLLLLIVLTFVLTYAARLYPASMPGDVQLHVNRYMKTVLGQVYIEAQHRGLPFPFPNGLYVAIAPLTLLGGSFGPYPHHLFELVDGLLEASGVLLIYLLMARASGQQRLGVLAAAVYALTAGGHMVTWFTFATQVSGQWFALLLVTVLVFRWPQQRDWLTWVQVFLLLVQVFLAHIGQFLNLSLVGLLLIPLLWWRADSAEARQGTRWLLGVGLAAGVFAGLFYYSAFWGLIVEQVSGVLTVGLNEVTEREPIPRLVTLWVLWEGGLIRHFGFFPVLLALPGALLLARPRLRGSILPPLVWLSFLVSASQAVLPLITLNSITTRWLMFSAWAIAVTSAWALWLLWRRGRAARVVTLAMAGYVCWITIEVWVNAMTTRLPPIEPF